MAYIGCILFGLMFLIMTAQQNGSLNTRLSQTWAWIHGWAPFSYIIILLILAAPMVSVQLINSWPKHVEPEDPMAKYRREAAEGLGEESDD